MIDYRKLLFGNPSNARATIFAAFIGAIAVIVAAYIQKPTKEIDMLRSASTATPQPPISSNVVSPQFNPIITVSPVIEIYPPSSNDNSNKQPKKNLSTHKTVPRKTSIQENKIPDKINTKYNITGFALDETNLLSKVLNEFQVSSANISSFNAASGGKNILMKIAKTNGQTYEDKFEVTAQNVVAAIQIRLSKNLGDKVQ